MKPEDGLYEFVDDQPISENNRIFAFGEVYKIRCVGEIPGTPMYEIYDLNDQIMVPEWWGTLYTGDRFANAWSQTAIESCFQRSHKEFNKTMLRLLK